MYATSVGPREIRQRNFPGLVQKLDKLFLAIPLVSLRGTQKVKAKVLIGKALSILWLMGYFHSAALVIVRN